MSATLSNICPDSAKNGRIWPRSSRATVVIRIIDKKFVPKNLTILNMLLRTRASQADCALLIITAHCMCWTRLDITLRICAYVNVTICKYAWVPMCRERGVYALTLPCRYVYLSTPRRYSHCSSISRTRATGKTSVFSRMRLKKIRIGSKDFPGAGAM